MNASEAAARARSPRGEVDVGEPPGAVCEEVPMLLGALEVHVGSGTEVFEDVGGVREGYVRRVVAVAAFEAVFEAVAPMVSVY